MRFPTPRRANFRALTRWLPWMMAGSLLAACSNPMSLENYNKLQLGQTVDEVNKIVGAPARCDEVLGMRSCVWGDEQHGFSVNFVAGKVILLSAKGLK
jgi:hypothetical protein